MKSFSDLNIPSNLFEALKTLDQLLTDEEKHSFKEEDPKNIALYHHGVGRELRNAWGLWAGSVLAKHFNSIGIDHPDDMSGIILRSYHRRLNGYPIELEKQIQHYRNYWDNLKK